MPHTWKFVDQPVSSPTVLLDMNDGNTWRIVGGDHFELPSPPLRRSIASNAMSDGGLLTSAAYDLRTLTFKIDLYGSTDTARIAQLDALKAQLAKPANLIMHQLQGTSFPVFFRTLRSDEYVSDPEISANFWRVSCSVLAEPFAIGIRHDVTTGAVITNDPASGTNKTFIDITGVRGDSPAPAFARVAVASGTAPTFFWAQRTNNPTVLTVFAQAEAGTMGTDTTVQANDATMSGAGSNFVRTTFTTATLTTRLTVTVPTASDASALRGRYRVLVKTRTSATGSNFTLRYVQNPSGTNTTVGQQYSFDSLVSTAPRVVDLGVVEFGGPGPAPATIGYSGLSAAFPTQSLAIQIGRNSGTATFDMDYVYLLPADERAAQFRRANWASSSYLCIDGPQELTYGMASGTTPFGSTRTVDNAGGLASYFGGFPAVVPGVTNRWYTIIGSQDVTGTSTWDVSYWPRWREVATS
jgi:hypothetical protein